MKLEDTEYFPLDDEEQIFTAIDSVRMDSAMIYVGEVPGLTQSCGFKPHHVCNALGHYTLGPGVQGYSSIEGYQEFAPFAEMLRAGKLDELRPLRLFTGYRIGDDKAGTVIPLTPPILVKEDGVEYQVIIGFTARHCVLHDSKPAHLTCTHSLVAKWDEVTEGDRFQTKLLDFHVPHGVRELDEKVELKIPSTQKVISPKPYADLAAVKIYIRKGQSPPPGSFYVPAVEDAQAQDNIVLTGYGGQVDLRWAREFLLKPHEGPRVQLAVGAGTPSTGTPFVGLLDAEEAQNRLTQLKEEAIIHPYRLAITVGRVHNSNGQLVEHTASAMPGFSGAPGSLLDKPWSVVFMHIASRRNPETGFGLGVSMHHPLCGYMYIKKVLPMLSRCSIDHIKPHRLQGVQQYVTRFKSQWDSWGVKTEINQFFRAHAQSTQEPGVVGAVAMRNANIQV